MSNVIQVAVVMGSDSDYQVMAGALEICTELGVTASARVLSAHRTPFDMLEFASGAHREGFQVVIAGAGGAAHLPGMVASATILPVIGVPIRLSTLDGLDSLLSIVQMPGGVPVATVGINNAKNAGILAARILALSNEDLATRLQDYAGRLASESRSKSLPLSP